MWYHSVCRCNTYLVLCVFLLICMCSHLVTLKAEACWPEDDALNGLGNRKRVERFERVVYQRNQSELKAENGNTIPIFLCSVGCWRCSYQICTSSFKYSAAQIFFPRHVPCIYHEINPWPPGMICWLFSGKYSLSCLFQ